MKKTADEAINQLLKDKDLNLRLGNSETFDYDRIPFNIPVLDQLTGGGIPKKRFTLIYGPTNVGKSYLASQIVVNAQKQGGLTAWIDTELSWDSKWMAKCGVDTSAIMVSQPTHGEDALNTIRALMDSGIDVIVLDSIAGLVPTDMADKEFGYSPMAWQARFVNSSLPKLLAHLHNGSAFVAINQVRASLGPVALDNMPGGIAQSFFAHFLIQVRRHGWIKEKEMNVGFDMEIRLRKTKAGGENWKSVIVPFRVSGGIDVLESHIREAIAQKGIQQAGAWYTYKDTKVMGLNGIKKFFEDSPEGFELLKHELTS